MSSYSKSRRSTGKVRAADGSSKTLADHLLRGPQNEKIVVVAVHNAVPDSPDEAFALIQEIGHAHGGGCAKKPFHHTIYSPPPGTKLSDEQRRRVVEVHNETLGIEDLGLIQVVVCHQKARGEHMHIVSAATYLDEKGDFRAASFWRDHSKLEIAFAKLDEEFGFPPRQDKQFTGWRQKDHHQAVRENWDRAAQRVKVMGVVKQAKNGFELKTGLEKIGLSLARGKMRGSFVLYETKTGRYRGGLGQSINVAQTGNKAVREYYEVMGMDRYDFLKDIPPAKPPEGKINHLGRRGPRHSTTFRRMKAAGPELTTPRSYSLQDRLDAIGWKKAPFPASPPQKAAKQAPSGSGGLKPDKPEQRRPSQPVKTAPARLAAPPPVTTAEMGEKAMANREAVRAWKEVAAGRMSKSFWIEHYGPSAGWTPDQIAQALARLSGANRPSNQAP